MKLTMRTVVAIGTLILAGFLSGCATYNNSNQLSTGPGVDFKAPEVLAYRENQDKVLDELYLSAGLTKGAAPKDSGEWDRVINAGLDFSDRKCEDYLHALFRLNRDKRTTVSQIGLLGAASAGVLAALDAAARNVALTAIGFGLAASTVENLSSNLLFELDPSSVRTLVKAQQTAYRANLGAGYANRPAAVAAMRGYAVLCIPANIESEVNLAVKRAQPETKEAKPAEGQPPVVTNNEIVSKTFSFKSDSSGEALRKFSIPDGVPNAPNLARLENYLRARGISVSAQSFLSAAEFASERDKAAKFFGLSK